MIANRSNLKIRIIAIVLLMFVGSVWLMTFAIARKLEQDMTGLLESQQYDTVSYITSEIEAKLVQRINLLNQNAQLVADYLPSRTQTREFLKGRIGLQALFQAGLVVIDKNGNGIADFPVTAGREDGSFCELEYFQEVIATGKTAIGKPRIGRFTHKPGVAIAAPIWSKSGELLGVLAGFATLSDKNLFGQVEQGIKAKGSLILVSSSRDALIVSSNDHARILQPYLPSSDAFFESAVTGREGSSLSITPQGAKALVSTKMVPSTGWAVQMILPAEEAFAPIQGMKRSAYAIALALSILAFVAIWVAVRRALLPLERASKSIRDMTENHRGLCLLPESGSQEIQDLSRSFNALILERKQFEDAIRLSEEKLRRAELVSKCGNWELNLDSRVIVASEGAAKLYGIHPGANDYALIKNLRVRDYDESLDGALETLIEHDQPYDVEFKIRTADTGELREIHSVAAYDKEKRIVFGVIQDITERVRTRRALENEALRRRMVLEKSRDGIVLLRADGSVAEFNPAFADMLGYSPTELGLNRPGFDGGSNS